MLKQLLVLALAVAAVNSQVNNSSRTDDYLNINRRQHASNIKDYDLQIEAFKQKYAAQLNTIDIQRDMLEDGLVQNEENLYPLEILNDFTKQCVLKYRPLVPTVTSVKASINACIATASSQVTTLMSFPTSTRNTLQTYYSYTFENDITYCNKTYGNPSSSYDTCITGAASSANSYTKSSQKTFAIQMEASQCSATANVKNALDCNFTVQNRTISLTAQSNTMINRCLQGLDECSRCPQSYFCQNVEVLSKSQVDYKSSTMNNLFSESNANLGCLLLKLE